MSTRKTRRLGLVASLVCVLVASATAAWATLSFGSITQTNTYTAASLTSAPTIGTSTHASDFANTGSVSVNWTALGATNNDGYQVNRAPLSAGVCGAFGQVGSNVSGFASNNLSDTSAVYNSSYCYRVNSFFGSTFTGPNSGNDIALSAPPSSGFDTTGTAWTAQTSNDTRTLNGVSALDGTHVWAVGGNNSNTDVDFYNGTTWTLSTLTPSTAALNGVFALDSTHVWAVGNASGGKLTVWFWNGSTWTNQTTGVTSTSNLMGVWAADSTHVWAVGTGGAVFFFNGTTWTSQTSSTTQDLAAVYGVDTTHVWAVGTHDGTGNPKHEKIEFFNGTSWSDAGLTGTVDFTGVWAADASHVWAVGTGGNIRFFNGTAWGNEASITGQDLSAIGGSDINNIWTVGKSSGTTGTVFFNSTGSSAGGAWTSQALTTANNAVLRGVDAADAFHAWTVGDSGVIFTRSATSVTAAALATEDSTTYTTSANWGGNLPGSTSACPSAAVVLNVGTAVPGTPTLGSLKVTFSSKNSAATAGSPTAQVLISGDNGSTWAGTTAQALAGNTTTANNLTFNLLSSWNSLTTKTLSQMELCIFAAPNGGAAFKSIIDLVHVDVN